MPGANCAIVGCATSRKDKIGIFKLPKEINDDYKKWRHEWLNVLIRTRTLDGSLKKQLEQDTVHICERHFQENEIDICKWYILLHLKKIFIIVII